MAHLRASPARGHDRRRGRPAPGRDGRRAASRSSDRGTYTVRAGDTLSKIASAQGVAGGWQRIWALNRDTVPNPNVIQVGQRLAI